ncbi:Nucleoside-diphosphate-sugar epimerase [Chryseobacterium soldanellicola]|uniref:Nucleoside-diphosphate-sugar epimerase n=1 Tax=Chryseobacterium soldanellicola TaxID=311333 RepID=A0A1H1FA48_9FLAO|nr:NmrA family NAD(P)-binding protein [Chryseobacterium soldanellicola]SDQ97835.1 Nucleoside-diphosphate-sugar epimerase [Chryseobacterium soldanellicola]
MKKTILVAGATGNLGHRICRELLQRGATVKAIVRESSDTDKIEILEKLGVEVRIIDLNDVNAIAAECADADCVISAVAGLGDVIIDLQKKILDGAIKAGVPRFIPSDFCTDYNLLPEGENRNFDLRRTFKKYIDQSSIQATSIFNGCFADILKYNTPILNLKEKSIGYWGDKADWKLDFTTMDDTAAFTAEVALDDSAPINLQVASFQISPNMIFDDVKEITGQEFNLRQLATLENFAEYIRKQRAADPTGETELYAKFQQGQYMYSMFTTQHNDLATDRYNGILWTSSIDYLKTFLK